MSYLSFAYNIWHPVHLNEILATIQAKPDEYVSLDLIVFWNLLYVDMVAIMTFLVWIKIFKYISFNTTLLQFSTTLKQVSR